MPAHTFLLVVRRCMVVGLCCLYLLLHTTAFAQNNEVATALRPFDEGNQLYQQGQYEAALEAYERALQTGFASGTLYYNMGNAYFRLDALGQAIRYYEKARLLMPENPELLHNLEIAEAERIDQFSVLPDPFWMPFWRGLVRTFGTFGLFGVGLFFYLVAAGLIGFRLWTERQNGWVRRSIVASAIAGLVFLGAAFGASTEQATTESVVVIAERTPLLSAPESSAESEFDIHEGLRLSVIRNQAPYLEVQLPNGTTGWVTLDSIAEI